jgi:hypothetical protein
MLDYVMMFADEAAARAALPDHTAGDGWAGHVIAPQKVVLARATYAASGDTIVETSPEVVVSGYFLTVSLPAISPELRDMPGNACRIIGDRATGAVVYAAPDLDPGMMSTAIIEPAPAGARYAYLG